MAGDKNPWRDIFSPAEWTLIQNQAAQAAARANPLMGGHRVGAGGWTVANKPGGAPVKTPQAALQEIGVQIIRYDKIAKDDSTKFADRIQKLRFINVLCEKYLQLLGRDHLLGTKTVGGKQLTDQIDVWVSSLGRRALKKADYLEKMKEWHDTAKPKYKDKAQLSIFLRGLAEGGHIRDGGQKLHATPYATIEKVDPYHRQTFVFLDPADPAADTSVNEMGEAFLEYLTDNPASNPDRATNANASFYEWLEYHPFCVGTPGVTPGAQDFKNPARIVYDNLDLAYLYMKTGGMEYTRIATAGPRQPLNTIAFGPSGKGPPGAVAFVWDKECHLWAHEHGLDGFVHASAKKGEKIRCSGMLVANNGLATWVTNQSGHYAPNAQSIYYFVFWLNQRKCLGNNATVSIEHDPQLTQVDYTAASFISWAKTKFPPPTPLPYFE